MSHIEGMVVLCVTIGKDGSVLSVHAISGAKELIPSAVNALEQWRFRPFRANGQPVESAIQVRVKFPVGGVQVIGT
jgi:TonB family protein